MYSLTERSQDNNNFLKKKIVPYENYLMLKNAYNNLKEKNDKLTEEKKKNESMLKQYLIYISEHKASANNIKLLFKKFEKKYKALKSSQNQNFNNLSAVKISNLRFINNKKNIILKNNNNNFNYDINNINQKQNQSYNENSKIIKLNNNTEILNEEYNNTINKYIEIINQLKKEIKLKEDLLNNKNQENENLLLNNNYINLEVVKNSQFNLINNKIKNEKKIFDELNISSKICEYNIISNNGSKDIINDKSKKILIISSKCCECIIKSIEKPKKLDNKLIVHELKKENNYFSIINANKKEIKKPLIISSNINLLSIISKKITKTELKICSKICEYNIEEKNLRSNYINKLIISSNICEFNIINNKTIKLITPEEKKENKIISPNKKIIISSKVCGINIISSNKSIKKTEIFEISNNKNEITIFHSIKKDNDIKETNLFHKFKNISISSKLNELSIIKSKKLSLLDKASNICEFSIIKPKKRSLLIISSNACELSIIKSKKSDLLNIISNKCESESSNIKSKKEFFLNIISNISELSIINSKKPSLLNISSNVCELSIIKSNKLFSLNISSKVSEVIINKINSQIKIIEKIKPTILEICKNTCEININNVKNENIITKKINIFKIVSNINEINIISKCSNPIKKYELISSKIIEINIKNIKKKVIFQALTISSSINNLVIEKKLSTKKFLDIKISPNINDISLISRIKKEVIISSKLNTINIIPDDKIKKLVYLKKLIINSKVSDINIIKLKKNILLELCSKVSEVDIIKEKIKNKYFEISRNDDLSVTIFNTIKKESRQNVAQKAILDNYINSINIGFDNIKEYDDYNKINEEKDEDSDNENDKLECEPVPSFILCIQKKEKIK